MGKISCQLEARFELGCVLNLNKHRRTFSFEVVHLTSRSGSYPTEEMNVPLGCLKAWRFDNLGSLPVRVARVN
jgi:hypothetical protein